MGKNLNRLVKEKIVDPDAAKALRKKVVADIEALSEGEIDTIIKFKVKISGTEPWQPDEDGSIF
jgi:hypothetical protein